MTITSGVRVVLADDDALMRKCLRELLEVGGHQVLGEAENGRDGVRLARKLEPDLAILDLSMPGLNGEETVRLIRRLAPEVKILVLTSHDDRDRVLRCLRAGAKGYVLKFQAAEELLHAVREVSRGRVFLSSGMDELLVNAMLDTIGLAEDPLTSRERQVLQLIAEGHTTRQAAQILCIDPKTAETHRHNLTRKLGIHDVDGLIRYATQRGMLQA